MEPAILYKAMVIIGQLAEYLQGESEAMQLDADMAYYDECMNGW